MYKKILFSMLMIVAAIGCSSIAQKIVKEPKVSLAGVNLKDVNSQGGTVVANIQVENPNAFALKVDAVTYDVEIGGKHLSRGELEAPASVKGNGKTIVPIPVPVKFSDLFASAMDFIQKKTTKYRVKGEAKFGVITIPFDNTGDLNLAQ
ncbi:MAG TPA: LEA type 2 family protein [Bdellovibrionales bacterium]|nr:LEA type 2 family protein [Bdellovibrionales bacterium]